MDRKTAMQQLSARSGARNAFLTNHAPTKYGADLANGLFTWVGRVVYFDYFTTGKIRRITIPIEELYADDIGPLAPSLSSEEGGVPLAVRAEYPGEGHRAQRTTMAQRAAWNTVNEWCTPRRNRAITLELLMLRARDAYARVTTDNNFVFYFIKPEDPKFIAEVFDRQSASNQVVNFPNEDYLLNHSTNITPEMAQYVVVARDAALEGRTDMPLHGMVRRHR